MARRLHLSWGTTWGFMRRAAARGLARRGTPDVTHVGVDEKSFQRRHEYVTVVSDLPHARVLYVADDRKRESAARHRDLTSTGGAHPQPALR